MACFNNKFAAIVITMIFAVSTLIPSSLAEKYDDDDFDLSRVADYLMSKAKTKRGNCAGFPCIFNHFGSNAGRSSVKSMMVDILSDCVTDPICSPGKRSALKRAIRSLNK
ncbi:uncharacterized protein LOC141913259 [Tubulanus polymorphus]|uniref:uncharacterized protein LOC141913259 n=1 Tax=Tubulanus polymorphus TaxID=672921 RepID=UPI003DA2331F